jgi:hypothetical protein
MRVVFQSPVHQTEEMYDNAAFQIGFWHPFGPHADETAEEIIERKQNEIEKNGWTLWSFQFRNDLALWHQEIVKANPSQVLVFCSQGKGASDPKGVRQYCNYFIPMGQVAPMPIPTVIKVPHPMGTRTNGSAFIVKKVIYPVEPRSISVEWLKKGKWQTASLPTRPEYLIRAGSGQPMRPFRAVLELQAPYLAEVGTR